MLNQCKVVGFIPTKDATRAHAFYVDLLGLKKVSEDGFALVVNANGTAIRIVSTGEFTPAPYTILGWEVPDITSAAETLTTKGVVFERFAYFEQDSDGIWTAPNGSRVAWFRDPDGNTLSISQHPSQA
ncbi:VOC family protein [Granulicella arctica]|uniref:VOC family protein n=1 Tax=Granulicella arctica TaxID=940613 RepID=UPI0021DFDBED|nr:VOC family protein [Granulicella arctica]